MTARPPQPTTGGTPAVTIDALMKWPSPGSKLRNICGSKTDAENSRVSTPVGPSDLIGCTRPTGASAPPIALNRETGAADSPFSKIQRVADDPAAGRGSAAQVARWLQSRAAASCLSHARKARTLADSRRFFGQTKA